jgi:hypothetical protein
MPERNFDWPGRWFGLVVLLSPFVLIAIGLVGYCLS